MSSDHEKKTQKYEKSNVTSLIIEKNRKPHFRRDYSTKSVFNHLTQDPFTSQYLNKQVRN